MKMSMFGQNGANGGRAGSFLLEWSRRLSGQIKEPGSGRIPRIALVMTRDTAKAGSSWSNHVMRVIASRTWGIGVVSTFWAGVILLHGGRGFGKAHTRHLERTMIPWEEIEREKKNWNHDTTGHGKRVTDTKRVV